MLACVSHIGRKNLFEKTNGPFKQGDKNSQNRQKLLSNLFMQNVLENKSMMRYFSFWVNFSI